MFTKVKIEKFTTLQGTEIMQYYFENYHSFVTIHGVHQCYSLTTGINDLPLNPSFPMKVLGESNKEEPKLLAVKTQKRATQFLICRLSLQQILHNLNLIPIILN